MKIKTKDLSTALSFVGRAATKRTTMPILNCIRINSNDRVAIHASDGDRYIVEKFDAIEPGSPEPFCVPFRLISEFVKFAGEEMTMERKGERLMCKSGKAIAHLPIMPHEEFPSPPKADGKAIGVNSQDLAEGIGAVSWVSEEFGKDIDIKDGSVHVVITPNRILCETCDRRTLAQFSRASISAACEFLMPKVFAEDLREFLGRPESLLRVSESIVSVDHASGSYSAKASEGGFYETNRMTGLPRTPIGQIPKDELLSSASFCLACASAPGKFVPISLAFSDTGLMVKCEDPTFSHEKNIEGKFTSAVTAFQAEKLVAALKAFKDSPCAFAAQTESGCALLGMESGDLIVMLATLNDKRTSA